MRVVLTHPSLAGKESLADVFPEYIKCLVKEGILEIRKTSSARMGYVITLGERELDLIAGSERITGLLLNAITESGSLLVMPRAGNPQNGIEFISFNNEEAEILDVNWGIRRVLILADPDASDLPEFGWRLILRPEVEVFAVGRTADFLSSHDIATRIKRIGIEEADLSAFDLVTLGDSRMAILAIRATGMEKVRVVSQDHQKHVVVVDYSDAVEVREQIRYTGEVNDETRQRLSRKFRLFLDEALVQ
jgi:hypothetical protein